MLLLAATAEEIFDRERNLTYLARCKHCRYAWMLAPAIWKGQFARHSGYDTVSSNSVIEKEVVQKESIRNSWDNNGQMIGGKGKLQMILCFP